LRLSFVSHAPASSRRCGVCTCIFNCQIAGNASQRAIQRISRLIASTWPKSLSCDRVSFDRRQSTVDRTCVSSSFAHVSQYEKYVYISTILIRLYTYCQHDLTCIQNPNESKITNYSYFQSCSSTMDVSCMYDIRVYNELLNVCCEWIYKRINVWCGPL
jgi:hypothetical protein